MHVLWLVFTSDALHGFPTSLLLQQTHLAIVFTTAFLPAHLRMHADISVYGSPIHFNAHWAYLSDIAFHSGVHFGLGFLGLRLSLGGLGQQLPKGPIRGHIQHKRNKPEGSMSTMELF